MMLVVFALLFVHVSGSYHTGQMYRYRVCVCVCVCMCVCVCTDVAHPAT